jgi:hypothetical protein
MSDTGSDDQTLKTKNRNWLQTDSTAGNCNATIATISILNYRKTRWGRCRELSSSTDDRIGSL